MKYKSGELLLLSEGGYSDYDAIAIVRVVRDFDSRDASLAYSGKKDDHNFQESEFVAYLVKEGYVEDVDYQEWHLGSYGTLDIPEES